MKKFKITLESHSHTMKEISEDYNITDGIYEVEVSDPENGSEIYQAVKKKYQKGNNMIKIITSALLATMTITASCTANTAWAAPIDLGISYMDNRLADEADEADEAVNRLGDEAVKLSVGSELNNIKYGAHVVASDGGEASTQKIENAGVYLNIPLRVQGTNFTIAPVITVDYYDDVEETIGGIGLNMSYGISKSIALEAQATANRSLDSSNLTGEIYSVGLIKRF